MTPLEQLKSHMLEDLEVNFEDQEGEMQKAIQKLMTSKSDDEAVTFSVGFSGKLNLDKSTVETALTFAVRTVVKEKHEIEDPRQGRLPLDDGDKVKTSVRIGDGPEVPLDAFKKVAKSIVKKARAKKRGKD